LEVRVGEALLQAAKHLQVPVEGEVRMQAADDVELGDPVAALVRRVGVDLLVAHLPGVVLAGKRGEAAKLTVVGVDADVGRVDVPVDVEVGDVAVQPAADRVGQPAQGEKVRRRQARQGIGRVEPDDVPHLGGDVAQGRGEGLGADRGGGLGGHDRSISDPGAPPPRPSPPRARGEGSGGGSRPRWYSPARDWRTGMRERWTIFAAGWMALSLSMVAGSQAPATGAAGERVVVLRPGALLDVEAGRRLTGKVVVVRGDRIEAVGDLADSLPAGAEVIDLPGATLLPGLVDAHVHLAWAGSGAAAGALAGKEEARATLGAGFTTVRNLGSTGWADLALRDAIERGQIPGPRMLIAGPALGLKGGVCDAVFQGEGAVTSAEQAAAKVRELIGRGVDVIKLCAGGGVIPSAADAEAVEFTE